MVPSSQQGARPVRRFGAAGNAVYSGGSTMFFINTDASRGEQIRLSARMRDAVRAWPEATAYEIAAAESNYNVTAKSSTGALPLDLRSNALMRSHWFCVTQLPSHLARRCLSTAVQPLRDFVAKHTPPGDGVSREIPVPFRALAALDCPEELLYHLLLFFEYALNAPSCNTTLAFCLPDNTIVPIHRGFTTPQWVPAGQEPTNPTAAMETVKPATVVCFWCQRSAGVAPVLLCAGCKQVSYCARSDCQKRDWKAFHKHECKRLASGASYDEMGLLHCRASTLQAPGVANPSVELPLAAEPRNNQSPTGIARWSTRLAIFILHTDKASLQVTAESYCFPHGGFRIHWRDEVPA
mmetsp:Transcript_10147/g.26328  ORF Transcript_10147/g.26328 Transcript_10147/m.26328 type:complete len:352 (-) Transcript_10147:373-1428(-)